MSDLIIYKLAYSVIIPTEVHEAKAVVAQQCQLYIYSICIFSCLSLQFYNNCDIKK